MSYFVSYDIDYHTPAQWSCWGGILVSLRSSVRPSVSAVRKMICSKGLRASPKNYSETLHHQWTQVITEEMSEETSLDHDQTGPKTSPGPHRRIMINILGILELPNYYLSLLLGILECFHLLLKQADVQLDEVTPVAGGLTLHSCYCN